MHPASTVLTILAEAYTSPEQWSYVLVGWGLCIVGFILYAVVLVLRGRRLARQVPPEDRRWMS
jgi:membrane protein implicated in regulation of membrane protease activity